MKHCEYCLVYNKWSINVNYYKHNKFREEYTLPFMEAEYMEL